MRTAVQFSTDQASGTGTCCGLLELACFATGRADAVRPSTRASSRAVGLKPQTPKPATLKPATLEPQTPVGKNIQQEKASTGSRRKADEAKISPNTTDPKKQKMLKADGTSLAFRHTEVWICIERRWCYLQLTSLFLPVSFSRFFAFLAFLAGVFVAGFALAAFLFFGVFVVVVVVAVVVFVVHSTASQSPAFSAPFLKGFCLQTFVIKGAVSSAGTSPAGTTQCSAQSGSCIPEKQRDTYTRLGSWQNLQGLRNFPYLYLLPRLGPPNRQMANRMMAPRRLIIWLGGHKVRWSLPTSRLIRSRAAAFAYPPIVADSFSESGRRYYRRSVFHRIFASWYHTMLFPV
jgi:hypothetical protein